MACVALGVSYFVYGQIRFMGFPDGFLTDLDRAQRILGYVFLGTSVPAGLWFGFLSWIAPQHRVGKKLLVTIALYVGFLLLLYGINFYLRQNLNSGSGG